jgi:hypothetical protein
VGCSNGSGAETGVEGMCAARICRREMGGADGTEGGWGGRVTKWLEVGGQ